MTAPRHINSVRPYGDWAQKYVDAGFKNPIPLPAKKKYPPPEGFTGRGRPHVDLQQLTIWIETKSDNNIGLRLWEVIVDGVAWEVIAIDVDHHDEKNGGTQLLSLEKKYGKLSDTWTNSSRNNGIHGHKFFRVPPGLQWIGNCKRFKCPHIDIISKDYRYSVVFPSYHPSGEQYYWYPPGVKPDGINWSNELPNFAEFPVLPDAWIELLTNGRQEAKDVAQDMDSTDKELFYWAKTHFAEKDEMCPAIENVLAELIVELEDNCHDTILKAHYKLLMMGSKSGHKGWASACREFERRCRQFVLENRDVKRVSDINSELKRSSIGALRKIKGQAEETVGFFAEYDPCDFVGEIVDVNGINYNFIPRNDIPDGNYGLEDWGNAEHFRDLFKGYIFHVENGFGGWILWDDVAKRWIEDQKLIVRSLYNYVKLRQESHAARLRNIAQGQANTSPAKKSARDWTNHAKDSGNLGRIVKAIELAGGMEEMKIRQEKLNSDRWALGCENCVVKWSTKKEMEKSIDPILFIENTREMFITRNTGIPYVPMKVQKNHPEYRQGYLEFGRFLKLIQPIKERRDYLHKLLGQTLLGENPEKIAIFFYGPTNTGKTTLLELMIKCLGDYGAMRPPRIYSYKDLHPLLATCFHMRQVGTDELSETKLSSDLFKQISGNTTITVELKGSNFPFTDRAQFTPIIPTNSPPPVPGEDDAFRGRLVTVIFEQNIKSLQGDEEQRSLYENGLVACLAWLVEGCARAIKEGIRPFPEWIVEATEDFSAQLSDVGLFVRDRLEKIEEESFVPNDAIMGHFDQWALENNYDTRNFDMGVLSKKLAGYGFKQSKGTKWYEGRKVRGFTNLKLVNAKTSFMKRLGKGEDK